MSGDIKTGWVIEADSSPVHSPAYFCGLDRMATGNSTILTLIARWTTDHNQAIRFAREQDAENLLPIGTYRVCEHEWD